MTLTQLEAFVLVARLGSVKAAARVLGVSEPAVSASLAALRRHFADPLIVRANGRMDLTPGGRRLVPVASQMVSLATEAEEAMRDAHGAPEQLRVVATSTVAEYVARPLLTAFASRVGAVQVSLGVTTAREMPALLEDRLADVGLGPRLGGFDSAPVLRHRLVVVAGPRHSLVGARRVSRRALAHATWLVDASGADPATEVGALLARLRIPPAQVRVFPSLGAAWRAAAQGDGVAPGLAHLVGADVDRGRLAVLRVDGTPVDLMWHVNTVGAQRRPAIAARLCRFLDTPTALQAMHRADGSVPVTSFRPPVHVTLWS